MSYFYSVGISVSGLSFLEKSGAGSGGRGGGEGTERGTVVIDLFTTTIPGAGLTGRSVTARRRGLPDVICCQITI